MDENVSNTRETFCLTRDDIIRKNALDSALEFLRSKPGVAIRPQEAVVAAEEFLRFLKD